MNIEDIIRMAVAAGFPERRAFSDLSDVYPRLERFASLVAAAERNKLAAWMIQFGFATGHGDTMEQLVDALGSEIVDRIECEIDTEREMIARSMDKQADLAPDEIDRQWAQEMAAAIRARSNSADT